MEAATATDTEIRERPSTSRAMGGGHGDTAADQRPVSSGGAADIAGATRRRKGKGKGKDKRKSSRYSCCERLPGTCFVAAIAALVFFFESYAFRTILPWVFTTCRWGAWVTAAHRALALWLSLNTLTNYTVCVLGDPGRPRSETLAALVDATRRHAQIGRQGGPGTDSTDAGARPHAGAEGSARHVDNSGTTRDTTLPSGTDAAGHGAGGSGAAPGGARPHVVLQPPVLCRWCNTPKWAGTHHCRTCGHCVSEMDHHCSFTGKCVGTSNLRHFVLFLLFTFLASGYAFCMVAFAGLRSAASGGMDGMSKDTYAAQHPMFVPVLIFGAFAASAGASVGAMLASAVDNLAEGVTKLDVLLLESGSAAGRKASRGRNRRGLDVVTWRDWAQALVRVLLPPHLEPVARNSGAEAVEAAKDVLYRWWWPLRW